MASVGVGPSADSQNSRPAARPPATPAGPHAFLGVSTTETEDGSAGALVVSVVSGGPAQRAGISVGDLIVSFDGKPVGGADTLSGLVQGRQPGDTVQVVIERDGSSRTVSVTLGTKPTN